MNIKTALKRKNKLAGLIAEEFAKATAYNSVIEGNIRPYTIRLVLADWQKLSQELVELKTSIHKANTPVYDKIFLLSELKGQIKSLRGLDCTSGKVISHYSIRSEADVIKTTEITVVEKDQLIKELSDQIDTLQNELDEFNYKTII